MDKKRCFPVLLLFALVFLFPSISMAGQIGLTTAADTVYVDDFERANGPLGADWTADSPLVIDSGEVEDTDTSGTVDDLAVYLPHTNPLGVSLIWGDSATAEGIDKAGLAVMVSDADTLANGYYIFKNEGTGWYALRLLENGVMSTRIATGSSDRLYPAAGDTFQVRIRSDQFGHHFDVFYNHELDATITDPDKLYGNEATLYSGLLLGGGVENNIEEFRFVHFYDDSVPPSDITDLSAVVRSDTSIFLQWTASGDDGMTGTAKSYEIRHHSVPIDTTNWDDAFRVTGEPLPAAPGTADSMLVADLDPDTEFYIAMKVSDGFPSANFSALSNVVSGKTFDMVPPSRVTDLHVVSVDERFVTLGWTAPGDSDTLGTASAYDFRYSPDPIGQGNFTQATETTGEPAPASYGTYQEFSIPLLPPNTHLYFAMQTEDENHNWSLVSNDPDTTTSSGTSTFAYDDFERSVLGTWWTADPELSLAGGELINLSAEDRWDFSAIFNTSPNVEGAYYQWSESVDPEGTRNAGLVLMMDAADPDANGYLIFRHDVMNRISLWNVVNGAPISQITSVPSNLADPVGSDRIRIEISRNASGNHFDYYINDVLDNRITDPDTTYGTSGDWYCGLMIHSSKNNNIESFGAAGPTTQIPPSPFFLLEPFDGDTLEVASPLFDWMDALDLNPSDSVYYSLFYGLSSVFAPGSTLVVPDLTESEYQVPPAELFDLYKKSCETAAGVPGLAGSSQKPSSNNVGKAGKRVLAKGGRGDIDNPQESSALPDDIQVFWKVATYDNTRLDTTWSVNTNWSFYTSIPDAPNPFDLIRPADGDTITVDPLEVSLIWHAVTDPDPTDSVFTYDVTYERTGGSPVTIENLTDTTVTTPQLVDNSTYTWYVTAEDEKGLTRDSDTWTFLTRIPSGIDDPDKNVNLPRVFALSQNYPNPFNPRTTINFDVPEKAEDGVNVTLEIFSLRGMKVITLIQNKLMEPGSHTVTWNGRNERGNRIGSGIYIYRIKAGDFTSYRKMVVLK